MKMMSTFRKGKSGSRSSHKRFQAPCTDVYPARDFLKKDESNKFRAVFLKSTIWKPGAKGEIGITFGDFNASGVSKDAAWSHIGSNSTDQVRSEGVSMCLGFIDPPYNDFEYNGKTYNLKHQHHAHHVIPFGNHN